MSWMPATEPVCTRLESPPAVELIIEGRQRDIGGLTVTRVLPSAARRMVGPFIFFDHMGPATLARGQGVDVRPHPHINLATVTYLFEGEIVHRDSIGSLQPIRPGEINWMTAGRGIAHSERTSPELRKTGSELHGIQLWVALPTANEEPRRSPSRHRGTGLQPADGGRGDHVDRADHS
jgi:redox-sensitive bicupin YhaK (pirin superfamily)